VGVNRLGIGVVLPFIGKEFHTSQFQLALLITGTSVTWAISSWGSGWLSDRYGRKKILIPGAIAAVGFTAAMGAAWSWLSLFIIRDLIGIGDGVGWPSGQSTLAEEVPAERRALASGIFTAGYPFLGSVVGSIVIAALIKALGWRSVFPILSIVFLGVIIALWVVMREPKRNSVPDRLDWRNAVSMMRNRYVIFLMLIQAGALGWLQVGVLFNTQWLLTARHTGIVTAGAILSVSAAVGVVGTL
ncbi:MAG: MFS transporter, partial [Candidatus Dormibacteraeota bacterium]|nr:MFS transporter [Candidatus Dormibacteraeota bacterium]